MGTKAPRDGGFNRMRTSAFVVWLPASADFVNLGCLRSIFQYLCALSAWLSHALQSSGWEAACPVTCMIAHWYRIMAARDELIVAAGLICVKFVKQYLLKTTELLTSARRGVCQMRAKADKGREGCKNYIFLRTSFMIAPSGRCDLEWGLF